MNMIRLLVAKANSTAANVNVLSLDPACYHIFDSTGEYKNFIDLRNTHAEYIASLQTKYKNHIFIRSYVHKGDLRLVWSFVNSKGMVNHGIEMDEDQNQWNHAINPRNRKPWYWERKISGLKRELPHWATDPQEACCMRSECKDLLDELESNFNINSNYYRIQKDAALEAHSIINACDSVIDNFENDMAQMEHAMAQHELD